MPSRTSYEAKFQKLTEHELWSRLDGESRGTIREIAFQLRLTFQEFRDFVVAARDLEMWDETPLHEWWRLHRGTSGAPAKKRLIGDFRAWFKSVRNEEKVYPVQGTPPPKRKHLPVQRSRSEKAIYGMCPVASADTLCCRLRTIDAVEACPYGCTYCTVQTFYGGKAVFDRDFASKLAAIPMASGSFMHFGSGQASDSLAWGNRYGVLDDLLDFAAARPQILLELKTKSLRVGHLLRRSCPPNVVCTWSLNTDAVIRNEEHFTPTLAERLSAARKVADKGIKVGFHFHPMIYYRGWRDDYRQAGLGVMESFDPGEVLFISFGSVTFIKPVIRAIRLRGGKSKALQMPLALDPKGKVTYPDEIKVALFRHLHGVFSPWHEAVYFYLCMEKRSIWEEVFGASYASNEEFEADLGKRAMAKIGGSRDAAGSSVSS